MEGFSLCDLCGVAVPIPARQHLGWVDGHYFGYERATGDMLVVQQVRCRRHLDCTDPDYSRRELTEEEMAALTKFKNMRR